MLLISSRNAPPTAPAAKKNKVDVPYFVSMTVVFGASVEAVMTAGFHVSVIDAAHCPYERNDLRLVYAPSEGHLSTGTVEIQCLHELTFVFSTNAHLVHN